MSLIVEAERWCGAVVGHGITSGRAMHCGDVALTLCAGCGAALCEKHAALCTECGQSFCEACDHVCQAVGQAA
jgi:hypothetical protein